VAKSKRNIEEWEAALIKAMLASGEYTRDQIVAYFTRPERTVNSFRIAEIASDEKFADVEPANVFQIEAYKRSFDNVEQARQSFFEANPLHPISLRLLLTVKNETDELLIEETDRFECKESLNFGHRATYARLIAALANARGGVILFGVRDTDKKIIGIKAGKLTGYDPAKLNQYLSASFSPVPLWQKGEIEIAGKTVGVLYVPQAEDRPLICLRDDGDDLREGDIYYRYPGENRRIRHAELQAIIRGKTRQTERQWRSVLQRVERAGVENVAILNTQSGEVTGHSGKFLIDEDLIPKLKFISEGHFTESGGEPALRLLGDLQPLRAGEIAAEVVDYVHVNDDALIEAFVGRAMVGNPRTFIEHAVFSAKTWLPIFYFVRQAGLSDDEAAALLRQQKGAKVKTVERQVKRLLSHEIPAGAAKPENAEPQRSSLLHKAMATPNDEENCKALVKALRTLKPGEVDPDYILPLLKVCYDTFKGGNLPTLLQYAVAHIDVILHLQARADV